MPGSQWWRALPPVETTIQCGEREHVVRWSDGSLTSPAHEDFESEMVLSALSGLPAECIEVAQMWARHADDLDVLMLGPRSAADRVASDWKIFGWHKPPGPASAARGSYLDRKWASRMELLSLFVLGPAFQMRLAGAVAASLSDRARAGDHAASRPRLAAALTGRLAAAAEEWLGMDPNLVTATVLEGPGWGSLEMTGAGDGRNLRASLPLTWLAQVWACGLAVADGHLVVAVGAARWPDAEVLAVPEPGAEPVVLRLRGSQPAGKSRPAHAGQRPALTKRRPHHDNGK